MLPVAKIINILSMYIQVWSNGATSVTG